MIELFFFLSFVFKEIILIEKEYSWSEYHISKEKKNSFHDYLIFIYSSVISIDLFLCPSFFGKPSSFIKFPKIVLCP